MSKETRLQVAEAVRAIQSKKGEDLVILEMDPSGSFTDYFVVVTGTNPRQVQALSDEVEKQLIQQGVRPSSIEGYSQAEWVLLDYVDFVVHIFSERARKFYDLERLWKTARHIAPADLAKKPAVRKLEEKPKPARKTVPPRRPKARSVAGPKSKRLKPKPASKTKSKKKLKK
jgi:ribosome-associated protein